MWNKHEIKESHPSCSHFCQHRENTDWAGGISWARCSEVRVPARVIGGPCPSGSHSLAGETDVYIINPKYIIRWSVQSVWKHTGGMVGLEMISQNKSHSSLAGLWPIICKSKYWLCSQCRYEPRSMPRADDLELDTAYSLNSRAHWFVEDRHIYRCLGIQQVEAVNAMLWREEEDWRGEPQEGWGGRPGKDYTGRDPWVEEGGLGI